MDQTFACVLLLLSSSAAASKYVFIDDQMSWHDAQIYCRTHHTDLAPVSNAEDMAELQSLTGFFQGPFWIGLERDQANRSRWRWSGGGEVTTFFWGSGQPNDRPNEDYGLILHSTFHDASDHRIQFLCFSAVVVREGKTWEEAVEHCRECQRDLASVTSETEMELIRKEVGEDVSTDRVWIGLRFFSGRWLWVDGRWLTYEAWDGGGAPICPAFNMDCVSLRASGGPGSNAANGNAQQGWEAGDCEERLHFVCY